MTKKNILLFIFVLLPSFLLADSEFVLDISGLEEQLDFIPKHNDKEMLIEAYKAYLQG
mgnify:CR=1 FL=1